MHKLKTSIFSKVFGSLVLISLTTLLLASIFSFNILQDLGIKIIPVVLISQLVGLVIAVIITRNIVAPIQKVIIASQKVALGDFSVKVELDRKDKIKDLADNFNNMATRLEEMFNKLTGLYNLKKDFVANASHELRTPLAAIKGYLETLEDELRGEQQEYLKIIQRNVDRLINLTEDLLSLSEIEDENINFNFEPIRIETALNNSLYLFEEKAKAKGIKIKTSIESRLPKVKGDSYRLEEVFNNLIDNAIKYSEWGTIEIEIAVEENMLHIKIKDSGIGIPECDKERVFERFYVVDKSRSRKHGGTGLGLSIVKHIVLAHKGMIDLASSGKTGSEFVIKLPYIA